MSAGPGRSGQSAAGAGARRIAMLLVAWLIALSEIPVLSSIGRVVAPGALLALLLGTALAWPAPARRRQGAPAHPGV